MCSQIRKLTDFYESHVVQPQEESKSPVDFDWLFLDANKKPAEVLPKPAQQEEAKKGPVDVIGGARILKVNDPNEMGKIAEWVGGKRVRLEKQYRMSEDGFKRAVWMEKCGMKGPLLHVIESDQGRRFGGYSHVKWPKTDEYKFHPDPKAFLFSLTHFTKHPVK